VREGSPWRALGCSRVPTQAIESLALFARCAALLVRDRRRASRRDGDLVAMYFAGYATIRLAIETLRDDPRGALPLLPAFLSPSQWIALTMLAAAASLAATRGRRVTLAHVVP
jgi:prolipoprotein diacylglyceryltransferase